MKRMRKILPGVCGLILSLTSGLVAADRPNILFCIADDWGWPNAGVYGDGAIKTPAFDRLATEGVLFENAFVSSPSCTPSRNALLTGQYHWRLREGGNLWSSLHPRYPVFPLLLRDAGYAIGHWRKAWGPGNFRALGRTENPVGPTFRGFADFLARRPADKPFFFWLGASDPHRPYVPKSGARSGIDISKITLPADFPDHEIVRNDVADYYFEVQRFDRDVVAALALLEKAGELENTIVVMTGDHGMPFPRHKCHLYDAGTHVPLAIRWGKRVKAGRRVTDFVSFTDLAPTFLEAAGVDVPTEMTGRSITKILASPGNGQIAPRRDHVLTGRERHTIAQVPPSTGGYPMRAIRKHDFLYIRNFSPDRWPSGGPERNYRDCDGGPTKTFLLKHRDAPDVKQYFDLAFARRPAEELYDLAIDPHQLLNVAGKARYKEIQATLEKQLMAELKATGDPRVTGGGEQFDQYRYFGRAGKRKPGGKKKKKKKQESAVSTR